MPAATTLRRVRLASASDDMCGPPTGAPGCALRAAAGNLSGGAAQFQPERVNGSSVVSLAGNDDGADDVGAAAIAHDESIEGSVQRCVGHVDERLPVDGHRHAAIPVALPVDGMKAAAVQV